MRGSPIGTPASVSSSAGRYKRPIAGVLVDVADDVGELQRAPEVVRDREASVGCHREGMHRQPPDRDRYTVAVQVEHGLGRRDDVRLDVHQHAVDDR